MDAAMQGAAGMALRQDTMRLAGELFVEAVKRDIATRSPLLNMPISRERIHALAVEAVEQVNIFLSVVRAQPFSPTPQLPADAR